MLKDLSMYQYICIFALFSVVEIAEFYDTKQNVKRKQCYWDLSKEAGSVDVHATGKILIVRTHLSAPAVVSAGVRADDGVVRFFGKIYQAL